MDKIQKVLVKAGRKDLAQLYYKKISSIKSAKMEDATFDYKEKEDAENWVSKRIKIKDVYIYNDESDTYLLFALPKGSKTDEIEELLEFHMKEEFDKENLYKLKNMKDFEDFE